MTELLARLKARPWVAVELVVASLIVSVLGLASSIFTILVLNRYVGHGVDTTLATLTAGVVIAIALEFGFREARLKLAQAVSLPKDRALAAGAFRMLTGARLAALEAVPPGLRREAMGGVDTVQSAYGAPNLCALLDVPMALVFLLALFLLNWVLATIATAVIVLALLLSLVLLAALKQPTRELTATAAKRGGILGAAIAGAASLRAFNAQGYLQRLWAGESRALEALRRRIAGRQSLMQSVNGTIQALLSVAITAVGAILVVRNQLDIGAMIGATILATRALGNITRLAHLAHEFAKARQALDTLRELARLPMERAGGNAMAAFNGRLELKDVGFVHPGAATPLFESLSLALEPGTVLVVAGGNGAGKTTLAQLLVGLLEPRRGQILADGVDVQQLAPEWWRRQLVYLPQEPRFLGGTLRDNLLAGNPQLDDAAISRLIDAVGLRAYVMQSPGGLDAPVAGGGENLSLGLRRRFALARALANDGRLGVFDEPTEGLDADGAAHVYRVMNEMARRGCTIVAFSHDPNILRGAHVLVDLDRKPTPTVAWLQPRGAAAAPALKEVTG